MIPYYSPNMSLIELMKLPFHREATASIRDFFRNYTGKRRILLTNSCRSALYLAYAAMEKQGEVVTSPLTCKVAIDPIIASGNEPHYIDILPETLNFDHERITEAINDRTVAIQVIHHGGVSCNMRSIREIVAPYGVPIIEDCAQGFLTRNNGVAAGTLGDISCFSMIKNLYGIGGGVLATDNETIYQNALQIIENSRKVSLGLSSYRLFRNVIETERINPAVDLLFTALMNSRGHRTKKDVSQNIRRMNSLELRVASLQLARTRLLNEKRRNTGERFIGRLREEGLIENYTNVCLQDNTYTKLFVFHESYDSIALIRYLNEHGVEAKHLEHKFGSVYQEKLTDDPTLVNYHLVHDRLISLPLLENMRDGTINVIVNSLKRWINEKNHMD